jgi:hypothetical protein
MYTEKKDKRFEKEVAQGKKTCAALAKSQMKPRTVPVDEALTTVGADGMSRSVPTGLDNTKKNYSQG